MAEILRLGKLIRINVEPRDHARQRTLNFIQETEQAYGASLKAIDTQLTVTTLQAVGDTYISFIKAQASDVARKREIILFNTARVPLPPRRESFY